MSDEETTVEQEESVDESTEELSKEEQAMADLKEAITVEREDIGALRLKLTVTIPEETINERRSEQFTELKRDAMIPGFRKGHAPMQLVEKRFASDVGEDIKSRLISSGILAATEKEGLNILGEPIFRTKVEEERVGEDQKTEKVEVEKLLPLAKALEAMTLPRTGDLTFTCEVELKPEFELPELAKIPVNKPAVEIDDDDIEEELRRMRAMNGTFKPVADGPVEEDDMLYANMTMKVDGKTIETDENCELAARDMRIKGVPLIGLADAVVGKKQGDRVSFEAGVPDDHDIVDIRGKKAEFEFTINEIKRLDIPPIDEAFLSSMGMDSEKELREQIRDGLQSGLDQTVKRGMREQVGAYLIEKTALEIPESLSQRQTERSIARRMIEMYQYGVPEAEIKKSVDQMRTKAHDQTVRDLKLYFILEKIAEEREIDVPEEQINAAIAQIARRTNKRFDRVRDELSKGDGLTTLYLQIRDQQVIDRLLEDAEITEIEGPKKKTKPKAKKKTVESTKTTKTEKAEKPEKTTKKATAAKTETEKKKKKTTTKKTP
ncbi:MAG: trigger factor [Planctomycetes bacterium]|nr:trigger factor [Planctomycetota bacterium]